MVMRRLSHVLILVSYYHRVTSTVSCVHDHLLSSDLGHVDDVHQRVPVLQQRRTDLYTLTKTTSKFQQLLLQYNCTVLFILAN